MKIVETIENDNKRLIPISISNCGQNKYSVKVDENEPYEIECDEDSMRKAVLRLKMKNGDGKTVKKSSKNGTYKDMIGGQGYVWKSRCPNDIESFKKLLENIHIEESILKIGDLMDLLDETLSYEGEYSEEEIDKILDWATSDEKLLSYWQKLEDAENDKIFSKREQMFWNYFDKNVKNAF